MEKYAICVFAVITLIVLFDTLKFGLRLSANNLDSLRPANHIGFQSFLNRWKIYKPALIICAVPTAVINYFYGIDRSLSFMAVALAAALIALYYLLIYNVKTNLPDS